MNGKIFCVLALLILISPVTFGEVHGPFKGFIDRAPMSNPSAGFIIHISSGGGECNGNYWEINNSGGRVDLTQVLPNEECFAYIYVDDARSQYPVPSFTGSLTEPQWDAGRVGWYNGNDRCVGSVWNRWNASIDPFWHCGQSGYLYNDPIKQILANGNPNHAYQTIDCSAYIPVNATAVYVMAMNGTSSGQVCAIVADHDNRSAQVAARGKECTVIAEGWIPLKKNGSRKLDWYGFDHNQNNFRIYIYGYRIDR